MLEILSVKDDGERISVETNGGHVEMLAGVALALLAMEKEGTSMDKLMEGLELFLKELKG